MPFEGVVCVLKPPGLTSSDVVVDIRRIFHEKRVGHTGTLDPAAAGVLPVCIGRATRLFDYLVDKKKEYLAEIRFGLATDTEDAYGAVLESAECEVSEQELKAVLPSFLGEQLQVPPIYSSLNVNGVKMYKLARRGEVTAPVEERKRLITVSRLELVEKLDKNSFLIGIECSKGTYVRTLCRDIGRRLGVPAYMPFLLRIASGSFSLSGAHTIAELKALSEQNALESVLVPMDEAIAHIPALHLNALSNKQKRLLINGACIPFENCPENEIRRLYINEVFMGLCVRDGGGLHITVWLGPENASLGE